MYKKKIQAQSTNQMQTVKKETVRDQEKYELDQNIDK